MADVYLVYDCSFDGCSVLGAYTTRELAEQAMTAWVEQNNVEERELSAFHNEEPAELELYSETYDRTGELMYVKPHHYRVSVGTQPLDMPCLSGYQKWKQSQKEQP